MKETSATEVARSFSAVLDTHRTGRPRGPIEVIIAATARATDRILLTTDGRAGFDELPGVRARILPTEPGTRSPSSSGLGSGGD
jgi:predicted nucleic acid-binding protein